MRWAKWFALLTASALFLTGGAQPASGAEDLGAKLKKLFEPTPPPKKRKTSRKGTTPTPSPSPRQRKSVPAKKSATPAPETSPTPAPRAKRSPSPSPSPRKKKATPSPEPSVTPSASPTPEESPSPSPSPEKSQAPGATLSAEEIVGIGDYPAEVRKMLDTALGLTKKSLTYKYGSADPESGGLDCSGLVYFVLSENGVKDVPRDASGQYTWVRKAGNFRAVVSRKDDTFELEELKPGDLLFWTGTYAVEKDPPITHTMIYLGREKKTQARVMVGASDGRVFHGQSRYGVGVFDFKVSRSGAQRGGRTPTFVGYGRIPGLGDGSGSCFEAVAR